MRIPTSNIPRKHFINAVTRSINSQSELFYIAHHNDVFNVFDDDEMEINNIRNHKICAVYQSGERVDLP
jgi:hypothetical protein